MSKANKTNTRIFRTASGRRDKLPGTGVVKQRKVTEGSDAAIITVDTNPPTSHPRSGLPGKGSMSKQECDKMVAAFRDIGPNMSKVSRACGLDRRTVARAWKQGVKAHGLAPIIQIIESEKSAARAEVAQRWEREATNDAKVAGMDIANHAKVRENMSADAIRGRTEEANMVRLARGDATQCLAAVARLLPGLNKWAKHAAETLNDSNPKGIAETIKLMSDVSKVVERTANAASTIMAMERRLLGQPETIIGVQMPDLTMEEAMIHVAAIDRTMARGRALGLFPPIAAVIDAASEVYATEPDNAPIITDNEAYQEVEASKS